MCVVTFWKFFGHPMRKNKIIHSIYWIWRKRPGSCKLFTFLVQTWWCIHVVILKGKVPMKVGFLEKWKLITFNSPSCGNIPKCHAYKRNILRKWVLNLIYSGSIYGYFSDEITSNFMMQYLCYLKTCMMADFATESSQFLHLWFLSLQHN